MALDQVEPISTSRKDSFKHIRDTQENFALTHNFLTALAEETANLPQLRVLDFGAGINQYNITLYANIRRGQETVAYEPRLKESFLKHKYQDSGSVLWTNELPTDREFDLAICSFSLHHMEGDPSETLVRVAEKKPPVLAVFEYDFKEADLEDFRKRFVSEMEQKELLNDFDGDWQRCFDYHRKYGQADYRRALEANGYNIAREESGVEVARNKFFLIGKKP